jgi:hypothetical protein
MFSNSACVYCVLWTVTEMFNIFMHPFRSVYKLNTKGAVTFLCVRPSLVSVRQTLRDFECIWC